VPRRMTLQSSDQMVVQITHMHALRVDWHRVAAQLNSFCVLLRSWSEGRPKWVRFVILVSFAGPRR
jgi:hypothetical protein